MDDFIRERERERPGFRALLDAAVRRQQLLHTLADRRRQLGMSQPAVAEFMRTSQSAVARLEAGDGNPRFSTLERYAAAVGVSIAWQLVEANGGPLARTGAVRDEPDERPCLQDVIDRETVTLSADATLAEATRAMGTGQGGVIVLEPNSETVCGVVTTRETARAVAEGRDLDKTTLSDVCQVVTMEATDRLDRAIELMLAHDLHDLPVIDATNRPVGMVSMTGVVKELMRVGPAGDD